MAASRVLRSRLDRIFFLVLGAVAVLASGLALVLLLAAGDAGPGSLIGFAAVFAAGLFLLRLAMVKVVVHDDHVELVNPLRRFRVAWSDVEDVDITSAGGWIVRVWFGGEPHWAWGVSRFGQFGAVPFASRHDDPAKDAPPFVRDGYRELRRAWATGRPAPRS